MLKMHKNIADIRKASFTRNSSKYVMTSPEIELDSNFFNWIAV